MPERKETLHIRELRRCCQQMFMGYASLKPSTDTKHREKGRQIVLEEVVAVKNLHVIGDQGEPVDDVADAVNAALESVMEFDANVPTDQAS
jgi:hypothetical protein